MHTFQAGKPELHGLAQKNKSQNYTNLRIMEVQYTWHVSQV